MRTITKNSAILWAMKKLILIDDHKMLRKGISSFFTENSEWQIFAEAESLSQVEIILPACSNSDDQLVAIVDIQLKESEGDSFSGFKAINKLAQAGIPSVVFSSHDTGACIERAMSAEVGAKGFVSKLSDEKMLLDAVNTVAEGKSFVQPDLITSFMETHTLFSMLTKREKQVVKLIQEGLTNEEMAEELEIKITTLENYISVIYDKIGCQDKKSLIEKLG